MAGEQSFDILPASTEQGAFQSANMDASSRSLNESLSGHQFNKPLSTSEIQAKEDAFFNGGELDFDSCSDLYGEETPILIAEAHATKTGAKHNEPGQHLTLQSEWGKLKVPEGNPAFGLPANFKAYAGNINEYVKWIERWNDNYYGWRDMDKPQRDNFANALRHSLGIGYMVYQGMPPEMAIGRALEHETGDLSLDSKQDRHNNIWAAKTADKMSSEGKSWYEFVAKATYAAADAARHHNGFLK